MWPVYGAGMIASLMMYDRPELAEATARYWALIREALATRGVETPEVLSNEGDPYAVWNAPDLVLSQTCGMPYRVRLHGKVQIVGTPDFGLEGCPPGYYCSAVVVRADDPRAALEDYAQARFAYNEALSQSGFAAIYAVAKAAGFWFGDRVVSHGHRRSAQMVAMGEADIAAVDAQTWRLIERYDGFAENLRVLCWTPPTPGLPYITGLGQDAGAIADGVRAAIAALTAADREALGVRGFETIAAESYLAVANPPEGAA